jgi:hypothetical protein
MTRGSVIFLAKADRSMTLAAVAAIRATAGGWKRDGMAVADPVRAWKRSEMRVSEISTDADGFFLVPWASCLYDLWSL